MTRFLKERHYQLVLPGIKLLKESSAGTKYPLDTIEAIWTYMNRTGCSYTQEDTEQILKLYKEKYGA